MVIIPKTCTKRTPRVHLSMVFHQLLAHWQYMLIVPFVHYGVFEAGAYAAEGLIISRWLPWEQPKPPRCHQRWVGDGNSFNIGCQDGSAPEPRAPRLGLQESPPNCHYPNKRPPALPVQDPRATDPKPLRRLTADTWASLSAVGQTLRGAHR